MKQNMTYQQWHMEVFFAETDERPDRAAREIEALRAAYPAYASQLDAEIAARPKPESRPEPVHLPDWMDSEGCDGAFPEN